MGELPAQPIYDQSQATDTAYLDPLDRFPDKFENDPMKNACPTGGCPPENKKTNRDIYDDQIKQVAQKNNLDLSDPKQKRQAHMHVVDYMRPKLRENRKYETQDREGPPVSEGPEFIIKDRSIFYPKYGASLQQLYENQKRVYPEQYDSKEHATMTLMEQAFINGATEVSHVNHNKDAKDREAIRDQITMVYDPQTGKGRMEIRNIAPEDRFLSVQEAYDVMTKQSEGFVEGHPEEGVFILTDVPMESKQVHEVLSVVDDKQIAPLEYQSEITEIPQYMMTEFSEWIDTSVTDMRDTQRPFRVPDFLQKLLRNSAEHKVEDILVSPVLQALMTEPVTDMDKGEDLVVVWKQAAQEILEITEEEADRLVKKIVLVSQKMNEKREIISFIEETRVGMGAAIVIIDSMVLLELPKLAEKTIKPVCQIELSTEAEAIPDSIIEEDIVMTWLSSFIDRVKDKPSEEVIAEVHKEEEKTLENIATLWEVFREASVETPLEEKETVEQFQLAVVVWFLLKLSSYFEGLQAFKNTVVNRFIPKEQMKERIPEALMQPEATQWILLAIIWALAMKREQGIIQTTNSQQSAAPHLQQKAVIYAYAPVPDPPGGRSVRGFAGENLYV